MTKIFRNITILISPFLIMIIVNQMARPTIDKKPYSINGISAMNSVDKNFNQCSWICHNNTRFCKENHVKYLKPYSKYTDTMYFGTINMLQKTGNYGLANIIFLVVLGPILIWILIVKCINIQGEIIKLKKNQ